MRRCEAVYGFAVRPTFEKAPLNVLRGAVAKRAPAKILLAKYSWEKERPTFKSCPFFKKGQDKKSCLDATEGFSPKLTTYQNKAQLIPPPHLFKAPQKNGSKRAVFLFDNSKFFMKVF